MMTMMNANMNVPECIAFLLLAPHGDELWSMYILCVCVCVLGPIPPVSAMTQLQYWDMCNNMLTGRHDGALPL